MDTIVNTAINWTTVTVLTMLVAAFGIGGTYWKKTKNKRQDEEIQRQEQELKRLKRLVIKLACDTLRQSCDRALSKGTMTMDEYQSLQELFILYDENDGNGPGKRSFRKLEQEIHLEEDDDR